MQSKISMLLSVYFLVVASGGAVAIAQTTDILQPETLIKQSLPTTVAIYENHRVRPVSNWLLGIGDAWLQTDQRAINLKTGQLNSAFINSLKGLPIPLSRMAGASSQRFKWKWAVGPMSQHKPQIYMYKHIKMRMGPLMWVDMTRRIDPDAQLAWVFNMTTATPKDAADLAQLFTAGQENQWGRLRYEYGMKQPVQVSIWELGNEMYGKWTVQHYVAACRKWIRAVRNVIPDAHFSANAGSPTYKGHKWKNWNRTVLKELGSQIDYMTYHTYYGGYSIPKTVKYIDDLRDDIQRITGSNRIKIFISEHARWPNGGNSSKGKYQTNSLNGCLYTAAFLNRLFHDPQITAATYFCLTGNQWGIVYLDPQTGTPYTTGIYDLYKMLDKALGKWVVATKVTGLHTNLTKSDLTFTVTAMTTNHGLNLILVNHEPKDSRTITFISQKSYRIVKELLLTGPELSTHNTPGHNRLHVQHRQMNMPLGHFTIPPRSVVVLKCKNSKTANQ